MFDNKPIKDGKKPLSTKTKPKLNYLDFVKNKLSLPDDVKEDIEARGLAVRFIDAVELSNNSGQHPHGWVPYKRKIDATMGSDEFALGRSPDGFIRRGSLILGCRPQEINDAHKEHLKEKADRQSNSVQSTKATEMRKFTKDAGLDAKIHEGYEDNE